MSTQQPGGLLWQLLSVSNSPLDSNCQSATVLLLCSMRTEVVSVVQSCTACHMLLTQLKDVSSRVVLLRPCAAASVVAAAVVAAGVEHLLRNVKDATISTLASDVSAKLQALKGLKTRLSDVQVRTRAVGSTHRCAS